MARTVWVFPGQGSQATGMGIDLQDWPEAQQRFAEAEAILGWSVLERCQADAETLSQTVNTQPCLYVLEAILSDRLRNLGEQPDYVAGHSLGEYSALYAAGVFDFATGLRLVQKRAELMQAASGGKMAALIGFDAEALTEAIAATEGVVLANDNSAAQVVISGTPEAVDAILTNVKSKRAVPLTVSGAFHSPFMAEAAATFAASLEAVDFQEAQVPVLSNVSASPSTAAAELKQNLLQQMTGSVRWRETCLAIESLGVEQLVEVGPGKVLTGLMKRTCPAIGLRNVGTAADLAV
ncbi:ACP S-malonyltransferase [Synechococcus elongatus]|uniref:ACP S-malonyltransferase n=1 Tax=Synechococcus elongatus TaxID=32046 RepID=UPI0030CD8944